MKRMSLTRPVRNWKRNVILWQNHFVSSTFRNVDFDVQSILKMRYIHYRFGRIEKDYFDKFKTYIYDNLDTIFIKCDEDDRYIWGIYLFPFMKHSEFMPYILLCTLKKIFVPDQYDGTAKAAYTALEAQYKKTNCRS